MRIGVIGAGQVGATLGNGLVRAGHQVIYGSRDESRTAPHPGALLGSVRGAVVDSEAVILATPWDAMENALGAAGDFEGRVLVDATNPPSAEAAGGSSGSGSGGERVAHLARNARVVKGFNCAGVEILANPKFGPHRAAMFVAGDDAAATRTTVELATALGFDAVALDGLSRARDLEALAWLWIKLATKLGHGRHIAFGLADRPNTDVETTVTISALRPTTARRAITVVGSGRIGDALARGWTAAGHDVRVAMRDPVSAAAKDLISFGARAVPVDGAAAGADVVALAVPAAAVAEVVPRLGDLQRKILVDCTNEIGAGMKLATRAGTSSPEQIARLARGAHVVRAFNQQGAETLRDARCGDLRALTFVAGDDATARETVLVLARDLAFDAIDVGALESSRLIDHVTTLWLATSKTRDSRGVVLTLLRR